MKAVIDGGCSLGCLQLPQTVWGLCCLTLNVSPMFIGVDVSSIPQADESRIRYSRDSEESEKALLYLSSKSITVGWHFLFRLSL